MVVAFVRQSTVLIGRTCRLPHRRRQDRHQAPHRRATGPLPTLVRQRPDTQGHRRQARDCLRASARLGSTVDRQDRAAILNSRPGTSKNPDIAPAQPRIPSDHLENAGISQPAEHRAPSAARPLSDHPASLHGSRTQLIRRSSGPTRRVMDAVCRWPAYGRRHPTARRPGRAPSPVRRLQRAHRRTLGECLPRQPPRGRARARVLRVARRRRGTAADQIRRVRAGAVVDAG